MLGCIYPTKQIKFTNGVHLLNPYYTSFKNYNLPFLVLLHVFKVSQLQIWEHLTLHILVEIKDENVWFSHKILKDVELQLFHFIFKLQVFRKYLF